MAIVRLSNGSDVDVKLSLEEAKAALGTGSDFVELPGDDGPVLVRPTAVIAIIEDTRRGTTGFRIGGVGV
ncbi:MAG: hypothetical protein JOY80_12285 [Candidatus Dormibacteraeota bacterium]|nr:hypothetical protein [Candidatus Dormibacteraeota bacterium]